MDRVLRVVVVDDSAYVRKVVREILSRSPFVEVVGTARDGREALDLVLLDLVMKGMYGLDVLVKLRELDQEARVVVASADIQSSTRKLVDEAGALGFINKPFVSEQVVAAVKAALTKGAVGETN